MRKFKKSFLTINIILSVDILFLTLNFIFFKMTNFVLFSIVTVIPFLILLYTLGYEDKKRRFTYETMFYTFAYVILFLLMTYVAGIFIGFNRNVYILNISNLIKNILPYLLLIITSELFRYQVIRKGEGSVLSYILITFLLIIIDATFFMNVYDLSTSDGLIKYTCSLVFPSIFKNILLLYLTKNGGVYPSIVYRILMDLKIFIVPIVPAFGLYFDSVIDTVVPMIIMLLIHMSLKQFKNEEPVQMKIKNTRMFKYAFLGVLVILTVIINLLASCNFKYALIAIGSNSMKPTFARGDAIIYKKVRSQDDIKEGDILVFKKDNRTIVHRVINIEHVDDDYIYYTKGDNNNSPDGYPILIKDCEGIVKTKLKYFGIVSVYLEDLLSK